MGKGSRKVDDEKEEMMPDTDMEENKSRDESEEVEIEIEDESARDEAKSEAEAEATAETIEPDPVQKLTEELQNARENYLRLAAEFDNYKKRTARDFGNLVKTATESLILELLEFIDNFSRALESGKESPDVAAYHKGMKLAYDQLLEILGRHGLAAFDSVGEKFDPNLHDALMQIESDEYEPDHIAQEFVKGYKLNDKVIRHAKVGVVGHKDEE
jgi:molecular chaperone GrpE